MAPVKNITEVHMLVDHSVMNAKTLRCPSGAYIDETNSSFELLPQVQMLAKCQVSNGTTVEGTRIVSPWN